MEEVVQIVDFLLQRAQKLKLAYIRYQVLHQRAERLMKQFQLVKFQPHQDILQYQRVEQQVYQVRLHIYQLKQHLDLRHQEFQSLNQELLAILEL